METVCSPQLLEFVVAENIHTHPKDGYLQFQGGARRKLPETKILSESMRLNWKSQGRGGQNKKNPWGRYGYLFEPHNLG